jgi:hypothetical protein
MAKKQLKIPFKDGRPCKWVKDVHDEERDNYEFDECLEIHGFVRGYSSAVMILRPANDHGEDFNYAKKCLLPSILDRQQGSNTEHDAWNHIW